MSTPLKPAPLPHLRIKEVAAIIDLSVMKIYTLIADGELIASDVSRKKKSGRPEWRIDPADLRAFLERRRNVRATPTQAAAPSRPRRTLVGPRSK